MTELFRVNSLSLLKKEFSTLSNHAPGKTKLLTNIKRTRGRESTPFFASRTYKEIKPSSLDLSEVKNHRKIFDLSAKGYKRFSKVRGRSGRMLDGNPLTNNLEYDHHESKDVIMKKGCCVIDMDKECSRKKHFLSKFSSVYQNEKTKIRKGGKRNNHHLNFRKKKREKEKQLNIGYERHSCGLLYNLARSRTERTYSVVRPHSFGSYTKRKSINKRSDSSGLTYFNKKHIYPFPTPSNSSNFSKQVNRNKKQTFIQTRNIHTHADSFERSEKWYRVDLSFKQKNPKNTLNLRRTTGRRNHINSHCLTSLEERTKQYLKGTFQSNPKKKGRRGVIPRLTVTGRDCGVRSIARYVDSLVGFCDMNEKKYEKIRKNMEKRLEEEGYGIRVKKRTRRTTKRKRKNKKNRRPISRKKRKK